MPVQSSHYDPTHDTLDHINLWWWSKLIFFIFQSNHYELAWSLPCMRRMPYLVIFFPIPTRWVMYFGGFFGGVFFPKKKKSFIHSFFLFISSLPPARHSIGTTLTWIKKKIKKKIHVNIHLIIEIHEIPVKLIYCNMVPNLMMGGGGDGDDDEM